MAAAVLAERARHAGLDVIVESAGTSDWHVGAPAHPGTIAELARNGLPTTHVARVFAADDFDRVDLILAMDAANRRHLSDLAPDDAARGKVALIRAFDPTAPAGAEVPDPYGKDAGAYRAVSAMLDAASRGVVAHLVRVRDGRP